MPLQLSEENRRDCERCGGSGILVLDSGVRWRCPDCAGSGKERTLYRPPPSTPSPSRQ